MRVYIMFAYIETIGGGQNYVNSKVEYLEKKGWRPIVFSPVHSNEKNIATPWPNLKKFTSCANRAFNYAPGFWSERFVNKTIKWMSDIIGNDCEKIIIESPTDYIAEWGEILARKTGAKHICYLLDEKLELYGSKDFLYFKYLRGEVAGIHLSSVPRLFKGYKDVPEDPRWVLVAANNGAIQDVPMNPERDIERLDYNIAYIGRSKQYVHNITEGIIEFAGKNRNRKIQFIIIGSIIDESLERLKSEENVVVTEVGFLTPIPREILKYIDVVIAGAGCASLSAREGMITIVADAATCLSSGVLGYTVSDYTFSDGPMKSFSEMLEDVLIKKICEGKKPVIKSREKPEYYYEQHFDFINNSSAKKEYYNFDDGSRHEYTFYERLKGGICWKFPHVFKIISNMKRIIKNGR